MAKKSKYLEKLLQIQNEHQKMMNQIVTDSIHEQKELISKLYDDEKDFKWSFGEKIADKVAAFGGSWSFIFIFFTIVLVWMLYNIKMSANEIFDPYPFILLNLLLSCLAAVQAPIILMSQNRKEARDSQRAQDDYLINLKAELKNRFIDQKLDLFINEQFKELIEIQKVQINKMDVLESLIRKTNMKKV